MNAEEFISTEGHGRLDSDYFSYIAIAKQKTKQKTNKQKNKQKNTGNMAPVAKTFYTHDLADR